MELDNDTSLYNPKTISRLVQNISLDNYQVSAAYEWLKLLEANSLSVEKPNYLKFASIILDKILGFPILEISFETDNVEFQYPDNNKNNIICFEVKDTNTNLFAIQHRFKTEQKTPIKQTWDYMGKNNLRYGICTNYKEFILLDKNNYGYRKYHYFDFGTIKNDPTKLKEFIGIFSKNSIIDNHFLDALYEQSIIEEQDFTNEFYKLYHETRLMLIKEFQINDNIEKKMAVHFAQLFLNRIIFIFFAEDAGKIPSKIVFENIKSIINPLLLSKETKRIFELFSILFEKLDKGSEIPPIFAFNGGLFKEVIPSTIFFTDLKEGLFFHELQQHSKLKNDRKLPKPVNDLINKFNLELNPIIINILLMSSFDFKTELRVEILGHIFEQSINDLEEILKQKTSKQKKFGVFYTPEFITDFICRSSIFGYLSKKSVDNAHDLINEYKENIIELELKFKNFVILDPACGSGAFLLKSVDILLEISKEIQSFKETFGKYSVYKKDRKSNYSEFISFSKWNEENELRNIIENKIFGVDINEESVEITKLSLFLKIAKGDKKLVDLSNNIKQGNSLISDFSVDSNAFEWRKEFKEIFEKGGFDIIIGNPPYIRVQYLDYDEIDYLKNRWKKTAFERLDISTLFFELSKEIVKDNGIVCFISSNQFMYTKYGKNTRDFLLKNFRIRNIIDYGDLPVFSNASTYTGIFFLENKSPQNFRYLKIRNLKEGRNPELHKSIIIDIKELNDSSWTLQENNIQNILNKISKHKFLERIGNTGAGLFTGADEILLLNEDKIKELKIEEEMVLPVIRGDDPRRYSKIIPSKYVIYPYKLQNGKTVIIPEVELKNKYPNTYKYLYSHKEKLEKRKDSRRDLSKQKDWYKLIRFGRLDLFGKPKIITPGEVKDHKFTLDYSKAGFSCARVFGITIHDEKFDVRFILSILNSRLMRFYLQNKKHPDKKHGYYTYSSSFLNQVPIPDINKVFQMELINKTDEILKLYDLYNQKRTKFLDRIKNNWNLPTLSKKIEEFKTIKFDEFIKEIKKKVTISLKEQDELEDYFDEYKNILSDITTKIEIIEKSIDEDIYNLYELTNDEIKIIEHHTNKRCN